VKRFNLLDKVLNISAERYFKTAGDLFVYEGEYEPALAMVEKTLALEPDNVRALVLKGDILFCLNRDLDALRVLNHALAQNAKYAEAYISKAGILDVMGKYRDALHCCNKAMSFIHPGNRHLMTALIDQKLVLLLKLKKCQEAKTVLNDAASQLTPEDFRYIHSSYAPMIQQFCQVREHLRNKANHLSLRVIQGNKGVTETALHETP